MATSLSATKRFSSPMQWFIVLSAVGVVLALGLPPDPYDLAQMHTTSGAYRLAVGLLLVPYIIIWFAAFYAFAQLQEYNRYVKKSAEGLAFRKLMFGMGILAFGLAVPTLVSLFFRAIGQIHPGFRTIGTIAADYLTLFIPLVAFTFFSTAARQLVNLVRVQSGLLSIRLSVLFFLMLGTVYTRLTLHNHDIHPGLYYLNTFFLLITVIIPYLYTWFLGLFSAFEFKVYARQVKGLLYRRALRQLAAGITTVICGSIIIQFVNSTFEARVSRSLGSLLLVEYILLIIVATGLLLMAFGTKKLKKVEEV